MNMKRTVYLIMVLLTLSMASSHAQEIEIPDDAPRETWQLIYDDYRSLYDKNAPGYKDCINDVTVVKGEDCIYIQGLMWWYEESWTKVSCTNDGFTDKLLLWSNQPVSASNGATGHLWTGGPFYYRHIEHDTYWNDFIDCTAQNAPLVFSRNYSADRLEYRAEHLSGFWVSDNSVPDFSAGTYRTYDGTGDHDSSDFREKPCCLNPRLIAPSSSAARINITDTDTETETETEAPIYTITGVRVNRNNLAPGIYVSRGKKILVK